MTSINSTSLALTTEGLTFGRSPAYRIWGFLGGMALLACGILLMVYWAVNRLSLALAFGGLSLLSLSFRSRGVRMDADGLHIWDYWAWFFGGERMVPGTEIQAFALGQRGKKFNVLAKFRSGEAFEFPAAWTSVKDAQFIIDAATRQFDTQPELALTDAKLLAEAMALANAERNQVRLVKRRETKYEVLEILDGSGVLAGEIQVEGGWFRAKQARVLEAHAESSPLQPRWTLEPTFWGKTIRVSEGKREAGLLHCKGNLWGTHWTLFWKDPEGAAWSAKFVSENANTRTPFSMHFFRGLAQGVGSTAEQAAVNGSQGAAVLVAQADGPGEGFSLDVADDRAWPWVRLALASVWLRFRPMVKAAKE